MTTDKIDIRHKKIIDSREPWSIRETMLTIGWQQEAIYSADYTFFTHTYKRVGIERKTVSDLINSLGDRLSKQLLNMLEWCDLCILLIEGNWRFYQDKVVTGSGVQNWGWSAVWNYLQTWQHKGITIQLTSDEKHSIKRINELYVYYQKEQHYGGLVRRSVTDQRILALQCGGIGEKIGTALIAHFGSLRSIANASVDDFMQVEKIGRKKAESLYNHFNHFDHNNGGE